MPKGRSFLRFRFLVGQFAILLSRCFFTQFGSMDSTPVSLLDRLRQPGDALAWERFVRLYTPLLYHWLRHTGLQQADAADLVQDVLTVLVRKLPEFVHDRGRSFHGWLRTLVMNRWRDLRKRKVFVDNVGGLADGVIDPDPLESFIEEEYRGQLALQALRIMRTDFQQDTFQVVWELVVDGQSAEVVAQKHNLTLGAVYAAKCRVLARLRRELDGLWV